VTDIDLFLRRVLCAAAVLILCVGPFGVAGPAARAAALSTVTSVNGRLSIGLKRLRSLSSRGLPQTLGLATGPLGRENARLLPAVPVLLQLARPEFVESLRAGGYKVRAQVGRVLSLRLTPDQLVEVAAVPGVRRMEMQLPYRMHLDVNTGENGAVEARALSHLTGAGILIGLIDTGIDFTHQDFRHADGTTRIRVLWDQFDQSFAKSRGAIGSQPPVRNASNVPMGTVYTAAQINAALLGDGTVNSVDLVGHGTHVAGCAASNGLAPGGYAGVAPQADLIVVRVGGESKEDLDLNGDVIAALQWIGDQADTLGEPVVVNMSFGQHLGPHDGTSPEEIAIDDFSNTPGRVVTVSAGNERADAIHTSGSAVDGHPLQLRVDAATNDLLAVDCWFGAGDVVDLGFFDPTAAGTVDADVPVGDCMHFDTSKNIISLCVDAVDPLNNSREVMFTAEPSRTGGTISIGDWLISLRDEGGLSDGHYECWSAYGQPFTADVDATETVGIPATSTSAIAVGAASFRSMWPSEAGTTQLDSPVLGDLASFSSVGPTRDGRIKPDIVTGGNWVLSAWSQADGTGSGLAGVPTDPQRVSADGQHVASRGTSFSAPQVAGAVALLLQANPELTAQEIGDILRSSGTRDEFTGTTPNTDWGYGKLDVAAAVDMVRPLCVGDCNDDGVVSADELVLALRIALNQAPTNQCLRADRDGDGHVIVNEVASAVNSALLGCYRSKSR